MLLHDDDLLEADALATLAQCWEHYPELTAAFGKQWITNRHGIVQPALSRDLNRRFFRGEELAGLQAHPARAGILRMFPNDAYMIDTATARRVGYRPFDEVGDACDFDFGIRVCLQANGIWFVNRELARYRVTGEAISNHSNASLLAYEVLNALRVPRDARAARRWTLRDLAPGAASSLARAGRPQEAFAVLFSRHYSWRQRLSMRGRYHFLLTLRALALPLRIS